MSAGVLSVGVVAAGIVLAPGSAVAAVTAGTAAAPLSCHDTVSVDTTLTADLVCLEGGNGLVVDTDGVVLDLGGFTIVGGGWAGVSVTASDVVVRGGSITGFGSGVDVPAGASAVVEQVSLRRNITGLSVSGAALLRQSHVGANAQGVLAEYGGQVAVEGADIARNPTGVAARDEGSSVTVTGSSLRSNQWALDCSEATVRLDRTLVVDSGTAVTTSGCDGSTVTESLFLHNDLHLADVTSDDVAWSCTTFLSGRAAPAAVAPCS